MHTIWTTQRKNCDMCVRNSGLSYIVTIKQLQEVFYLCTIQCCLGPKSASLNKSWNDNAALIVEALLPGCKFSWGEETGRSGDWPISQILGVGNVPGNSVVKRLLSLEAKGAGPSWQLITRRGWGLGWSVAMEDHRCGVVGGSRGLAINLTSLLPTPPSDHTFYCHNCPLPLYSTICINETLTYHCLSFLFIVLFYPLRAGF